MWRSRDFDPFALWNLSLEITRMAVESQRIVALRMMGMAGLVPMRADEPARMVAEKHKALAASGQAMSRAMKAGKSATDVMAAGVKPMRAKTKANAKRLTTPARKT